MSEQTIITVRLTKDNLDDLLPGDVFTDDPEFGIFKSARIGVNGDDYALIVTDRMRDFVGLPQTLRITRTT